jgi:hypothetical protein
VLGSLPLWLKKRWLERAQLTARPEHVLSLALPDEDVKATACQDVLKAPNRFVGGTPEWTFGELIKWNQINFAANAPNKTGNTLGVFHAVILASQQHVLERETAVRFQRIFLAGVHEGLQRIGLIDSRHQATALTLTGRVQRHRKIDAHIGDTVEAGRKAGRGKGDPSWGKTQPPAAIRQTTHSLFHGIEIREGLAHSHEHNVRQRVPA